MPSYDYICSECSASMELTHSIHAERPACPECSGKLNRKFEATPTIFTGRGFYSTDKRYRG